MHAILIPVAMKLVREELGYTKAHVAREAKMQPSVIGMIEEGRLIPYDSQLQKIAKVLGVDDPASLMEQIEVGEAVNVH